MSTSVINSPSASPSAAFSSFQFLHNSNEIDESGNDFDILEPLEIEDIERSLEEEEEVEGCEDQDEAEVHSRSNIVVEMVEEDEEDERRQSSGRRRSTRRSKCGVCSVELAANSLSRHMKRKHEEEDLELSTSVVAQVRIYVYM